MSYKRQIALEKAMTNKTYPELVAEGIKRTVFREQRSLREEEEQWYAEVKYFQGSNAFLKCYCVGENMDPNFHETFQVKSAADAAKAYQKYYSKKSGSGEDWGVEGFLYFGKDERDASNKASDAGRTIGLSHPSGYGGVMNEPGIGFDVGNTTPAEVKTKSTQYFKQYDILFKIFPQIEKAVKSKNIEEIKNIAVKVEKTKFKGTVAEYVKSMEDVSSFGQDGELVFEIDEPGADTSSSLIAIEYYED